MKNYCLLTTLLGTLLVSGCSGSLPDCSSSKAKDTLMNTIREKVTGKEDGKLYIEPKFEIITTDKKTSEKIQCTAQIIFSIPSIYQVESRKKVSVTYAIAKNEVQSGTFSVTTFANFKEIEDFNSEGWTANQNYLYKKAGLEFLSDGYISKLKEDMKANPIAALGATFALMDAYSFKKVHQKLLNDGWRFDGESNNDKMLAIYSKEKFTLNLKATGNPLTGLMVDTDDSSIWED
jgi:hypothetical protein